jgi:hypothetical protein
VQPDAAGQRSVDVGRGVVQAAPRGQRQPLGQPAHRLGVREPHLGAAQLSGLLDPHLVGRADQHVGGGWIGQQRFQRAGPDELLLQLAQRREHLQVGQHAIGLSPHRSRHRTRRDRCAVGSQPMANPVDQGRTSAGRLHWPIGSWRGHAALPSARPEPSSTPST